ncbi:MAG TPA: response regulator transcription factor [Flavitalea sp.]|nr:response regulator transcription factor [Flavitalea sp.]
MKILIVEDEVDISDSICQYLQDDQFVCEAAFTFQEAVEKIFMYEYACILIDIGLPDGNGLNLLSQLKKANKYEGILIISAKDAVDDRIIGLRSGADDYLTKPFHLSELSARVTAIIRRKAFDGKNEITCDNLTLDLNNKMVSVNNNLVELTRKEYDLLLYLLSNKNKVISKNAIAEHLWGDNMDLAKNYDFIYTHIKNLKRKLMQAGCIDYIRSIYGMGYKFDMYAT